MQPNNLAKEVRKLLPGTDCTGRGGCGFATCDECAAAIAEGGPANLCPACKEEDIAAIVALTGGELVPARQETAFIKCSGCAAGKSRLKVYGSCEEAVKSGFAEHECVYGCVGAGSCVAACTFGALSIVDGNVQVDKEKCNGCGACANACVQNLIHMVPSDASNFVPCSNQDEEARAIRLCGYSCIGFGDCVKACRFDALEIVQGTAKVNPDKCVGCTACVHVCPQELPVIVPYKGAKMVPCASKDEPEVRKQLCWVGCIGCGDCVDNCPDGLIHLEDGRAVIEPDRCEDCNICSYVCPNGVITAREMPEFTYVQVRAMAAQKGGAAK